MLKSKVRRLGMDSRVAGRISRFEHALKFRWVSLLQFPIPAGMMVSFLHLVSTRSSNSVQLPMLSGSDFKDVHLEKNNFH